MKILIRILIIILHCVINLSAQTTLFNSKAVVKIYNYSNVDLVKFDDSNHLAKALAGHGTGLIIDKKGIILTNSHVIQGSRSLGVLIPGRKLIYQAEVIYQERNDEKGIDFAFIYIEGNFEDFIELPDKCPQINQLDDVFAWGYPMDFIEKEPSVVRGIVSRYSELANLWQMDAPINPGNSGGPVINREGQVLGISVSSRNQAEGMKYFMSLEKIIEAYREIKNSYRINDVIRKISQMNASTKEMKQDLLEFLVQLNLKDDINEFTLEKFETNLHRLSIFDSTQTTYEMADYAALASAVYYNLYIFKKKNLRYLSNIERQELNKFISKAIEYANQARKFDPSILSSKFLEYLTSMQPKNQLNSENLNNENKIQPTKTDKTYSSVCLEYGRVSVPSNILISDSPNYHIHEGEHFGLMANFRSSDIFGFLAGFGLYYQQFTIEYKDDISDLINLKKTYTKFYGITYEFGLHLGTSRNNDVSIFFDATWLLPLLHISSQAKYDSLSKNFDYDKDFGLFVIELGNIHVKTGLVFYGFEIGVHYRQFSNKNIDREIMYLSPFIISLGISK